MNAASSNVEASGLSAYKWAVNLVVTAYSPRCGSFLASFRSCSPGRLWMCVVWQLLLVTTALSHERRARLLVLVDRFRVHHRLRDFGT